MKKNKRKNTIKKNISISIFIILIFSLINIGFSTTTQTYVYKEFNPLNCYEKIKEKIYYQENNNFLNLIYENEQINTLTNCGIEKNDLKIVNLNKENFIEKKVIQNKQENIENEKNYQICQKYNDKLICKNKNLIYKKDINKNLVEKKVYNFNSLFSLY